MKQNNYYYDVLRHNGGFYPLEKWLPYAETYKFQKTNSITLKSCPDCESNELTTLGQYIHYSNLFHIKYCLKCGLYFSDKLLDKEVITHHFENTYKDEQYFSNQRKPIFDHISSIVARLTPENGSVLDVGGGKGHLLDKIITVRPDINCTLSDLSEQSCNYCTETYAIESICCDIPGLQRLNVCFDTVIMIDVIYYEPEINAMFRTIENMLDPKNGVLVIRIPNKLMLIKVCQFLLTKFGSNKSKFFQSKVKYFNPEHIYIFSQYYLRRKLKKAGFNEVTFIPSPLLNKSGGNANFIWRIYFLFAKAVAKVTLGKLILTPSMVVVANKHQA